MAGEGAEYSLFITSPLEAEHVERIRVEAPPGVTVVFEPDLLPATRYVADHHGVAGFTRTDEQERRWRQHLESADFLLDFPSVPADVSEVRRLIPNVKWVQTTSAGVGPLVANLGLQDSDIVVTTASGVHARPLAEFVFMALLSHVKLLPRLQRDQAARNWERFCSDELDGKTMAIVGPGKIGREVARIARCFGMRTLAMGRTAGRERAAQLGVDAVYSRDQLHEMLSAADAVVLSCPHTPETERMIDDKAFDAMKPGVMFVNIARGQVVVEEALLEALTSGKISFAALDVFATEPLPKDSPFWSLPNVLINPHSASTAFSENRKITDLLIHNLNRFVEGRLDAMTNVLDKSRLY